MMDISIYAALHYLCCARSEHGWTCPPRCCMRSPMSGPFPPETLLIRRWRQVADPDLLVGGIEAIFLATAAPHNIADPATRATFRERWLGRYLEHDPGHVWLALTPAAGVAGYLVGCLDDPARTGRFADIAYFAALADRTPLYPAHLHLNLAAAYRGAGVGTRLLQAFAGDAAQQGAPGMHAITGEGMRNVSFYTRNGFAEVGRTAWNDRTIVMLGRRLA